MVKSFKIKFFLNCRPRNLFGKRCLQMLQLLLFQILCTMLIVHLKAHLSLLPIVLRPVSNSFLSEHCFAMHPL